MKKKFWNIKKLNQFTKKEWEALCDGCGKCCLLKIEDEETGKVEFTNVSCKLLSNKSCQCKKYEKRHIFVDDCIKLDHKNIKKIKWMPKTCSYRLIYEGKNLPEWHHLISNDLQTIHNTGNSVKGKTIRENKKINIEDYIIDWVS